MLFTLTLSLLLRFITHRFVRYLGASMLGLFVGFQFIMIETKQRFAIFIDIEEFYLTGHLATLTWGAWLKLSIKGVVFYLLLILILSQGTKLVRFCINKEAGLAWLSRTKNAVLMTLFIIVASLAVTAQLYRSVLVTVKHSLVNVMDEDDFSLSYTVLDIKRLDDIFSDSHVGSPYSIIAHGAGGWFSDQPSKDITLLPYTNSMQAAQQSIADGKKLIELDLLTTSDGQLIAGHDWPRVKALLGYQGKKERHQHDNSALSFAEFSLLREQSEIKPLDIAQVNQLFKLHPELILVTDKTRDFPKLVHGFDFPERLIVECFSLYQCQRAKRYGIINTALNINLSNSDIVKYLHRNEIAMVTFRGVSAADTQKFELAKALFSSGIISLVYTSEDDLNYIKQHIGVTASAIYSDYFSLASQHLVNQHGIKK
jgi:glycerophosphoryl diester phosphodiesterase